MNKGYSMSLVLVVLACLVSLFVYQSVFAASKPSVNTIEAVADETHATLKAVVNDPGGEGVSQAGFRWGSTQANLDQEKGISDNMGANKQYSVTIEGLEEGHTYYYQAYAVNSKGTGYGEILSFTTPANSAPTVLIKSPEDNVKIVQGELLTISASADDDRAVKAIELFINDTSQSKIQGDALSYLWNTGNTPPGTYELKIIASDGNKTAHQVVIVNIGEKPPENPVKTSSNSSPASNSSSGSTPVSRSGESSNQTKYPLLSKINGSYGQFPYRDTSGGRIEIDPAWLSANIVTITLPGLNRKVQVHKDAADNFITAFNYIKNGTAVINGKQVPLLSLIKTMDGTFVPRHVNWNASRGLSNHSWGTAIDINAADHFRYVNPASEPTDPNYILWQKAFKPAGFSWGNSYGDAMHFELLN